MAINWSTIRHFKPAEFDSPDSPGSAVNMDPTFIRLLDELRARCGFPLVVNSGYRSPTYNAQLEGSVDGSAHTLGRAVDVAARTSGERFAIVSHARELGIHRIGIGKTFVHLDMDTTKPPNVIWLYG